MYRPLQQSEEEMREEDSGGAERVTKETGLATGEDGETPVLTPARRVWFPLLKFLLTRLKVHLVLEGITW